MEHNTPSTESAQQAKKSSKFVSNLISRIIVVLLWGAIFVSFIIKGQYKISILFGLAFLCFVISLILFIIKHKKNDQKSK